MVTQLYTAPFKATIPNQRGINAAKKKQNEALTADDDSQQGGSSTLEALKDQSQKGVISIQAIVTDFQNTMDALGVSPEVRQEVAPYLQVVAHQAQKPQPSSGLIKQNLKIAAESMDQFITDTLGQKSNVVREWVDALLIQPIEFHSDSPLNLQPVQSFDDLQKSGISITQSASQANNTEKSKRLSSEDQAGIKTMLQSAKAAVKEGQYDAAMDQYRSILGKLEGNTYPELEGRVLLQMGRTMEKASKPGEAKTFYQQAQQQLEAVDKPELKARVFSSLGKVLHQEGNLVGAVEEFKQALAMEAKMGDTGSQSVTMNQLGILHVQMGRHPEAKQWFEQALAKAQQSQSDVAGDVLSNLASLSRQSGKKAQALSYYKQSLDIARNQKDREAFSQTLQSIASLYLDAGKPEKALKVLKNALAV